MIKITQFSRILCTTTSKKRINGKNVPDEVVDTTDARFLHYQLVASDIDCIAFNALKSMKIQ